jgi:hypothetical protein
LVLPVVSPVDNQRNSAEAKVNYARHLLWSQSHLFFSLPWYYRASKLTKTSIGQFKEQ